MNLPAQPRTTEWSLGIAVASSLICVFCTTRPALATAWWTQADSAHYVVATPTYFHHTRYPLADVTGVTLESASPDSPRLLVLRTHHLTLRFATISDDRVDDLDQYRAEIATLGQQRSVAWRIDGIMVVYSLGLVVAAGAWLAFLVRLLRGR